MFRLLCMLVGVAFAVAACGSTPEDRGISGAGIGAAGGAVLGAVTGLSVLEGALIGAGVGGVTGALTDENTVNLGDPIWKSGSSHTATAHSTEAGLVASIQLALSDLGYDPGPVDGIAGPKTQAAIGQYQQDHGLLVDGQPTQDLLVHMQQQKSRG